VENTLLKSTLLIGSPTNEDEAIPLIGGIRRGNESRLYRA